MEPREDVPDVPKPIGPLNEVVKEGVSPSLIIAIVVALIFFSSTVYFGKNALQLQKGKDVLMHELKRTSVQLTLDQGQLEGLQTWQTEMHYGIPGSKKVYDYILHYYKRTPPTVARKIANTIVKKANKAKLGISLITAVVEQESGFNPYAVSNKDARGLMQVRFKVWGEPLGLTDQYALHEIDVGIAAGIFVIEEYLKKTNGDLSETLYLYVGKDRKYVKEVFTNIGKYEVFKGVTDVEDTGVH